MPQNSPEVMTLVMALLISVVSGVISIMNRIVRGHKGGILWMTSEFLAALLCGYLAWDSYPQVKPYLPYWVSMPLFIVAASYTNGRMLNAIGNLTTDIVSGIKRPPRKPTDDER